MHVAKYNKSATGHMCAHYERRKDDRGEYIKFGNQNIDLSRTHLNYNLAPEHDQIEFIQQRTSEVKCQKRADVNVMCDWVVTAPEGLDQGHLKEFFKASYDFFEKRYGRENVISAYVHMDETTPHMHFAFVPVVFDKKKEIYKVSAKQLLTKTELKRMHPDLTRHLKEEYSWGRNLKILNGATAGGNRTVAELNCEKDIEFFTQKRAKANRDYIEKKAKLREEIEHENSVLDFLKGSTDRIDKKRKILIDEKKDLERQELTLKKDVRSLREELDNLEQSELPQARQELIEIKISGQKAQEENTKLKEENTKLKEENDSLKDDNKALRHEQESLQQDIEALRFCKADLQNDVQKWQNALDQLKGAVAKILNSASENFKKIILLHTKSQISTEKAVEFTEKTRQLHTEKIDQLKIQDTIKEKSKAIIDDGADEVQEYIRPRRRGR